MHPDRWRRIQELFHRTADLPAGERTALLERECAADPALRAEVERLLRSDERDSSVLDTPGAALGDREGDAWIGRELGVFRLTQRIGAGGMGVVYAAERTDGLFEQRVAIKLIRAGAATAEVQRRFERERRTLAALDHPNIARLLDGGTTPEGEPYLVMELVEGLPIDRACDARQLGVDERLRLFATVCHAVHHAHANLVIHRDLKPANVLVDAQGTPKLLDFGIARLLAPEGESEQELTGTLHRVLTPEYASPEQLAGGPITTASDIYSLGVVLYGLLTGRKPFRVDSGSPAAWERLVSERPPTRPSTAVLSRDGTAGPSALAPEALAARCGTTPARLRHRLRGDLDRIVLMALRKEPERRYASADALAEDLERHLAGQPVSAREDSLLYRVSKFTRRNRIAVSAALLVALALVFGFVSARRGEHIAAEQARRASLEAQHARIEADSFREISEFLQAELMSSGELDSGERRGRMQARIGRQAEIVRRKYEGDPHRQANLLDALGRAGMRLAMYDLAAELLHEAHHRRRREFGADSLEVALSLSSLGELHYRRGEYGEAKRVMEHALELQRAHPEEAHTDVATAANDLAVALRHVGELERAEALHREALALRRARADGTLVAESLNNLAGLHLDRGEYEAARTALEETLEIRASILGESHPLTLQSVSNLANATWHVGEHEAARSLFERAAAGFRELRAEGTEGLEVVLAALASIDTQAGKLERARAALTEAFEARSARLGPEHPLVASLLVKLAELHAAEGQPDEARAAYEEALAIQRAMEPPSPLALGRTLRQYAMFLLETDALEDARAAFEEALDVLESAPSEHADERGRAHVGLGQCLRALGEPAAAREELSRGLELMQGQPGIVEHELELARRELEALEAGG